MKKLTNQGKSFLWGAAAIIIYAVPLIVLAIINSHRLFQTPATTLTFFSLVLIVFFMLFAKKVIKRLCKVLTPLGFGSLITLILSIGLRSIMDDLFIVSLASLCGAVAAWFPFQISDVYSHNAYDANGNVLKEEGMPFKTALAKLFQLSIIAGEKEEKENE